jgi:hypothetical protein
MQISEVGDTFNKKINENFIVSIKKINVLSFNFECDGKVYKSKCFRVCDNGFISNV